MDEFEIGVRKTEGSNRRRSAALEHQSSNIGREECRVSALATISQTPVAITPMEMLNSAITRGDSLDKLERLMDLNDRWEKAQAKNTLVPGQSAAITCCHRA